MSPTIMEQAEQIALEFADLSFMCEKEHQPPFILARMLLRFGGKPDDYYHVIELFCKNTRPPTVFVDFYSEFVKVWPTIQFPDDGSDTYEWAVEQAKSDPITFPNCPLHPAYQFVGSMAWHLGVRNSPFPFILPIPRLAKTLDCSRMTVSNILKWLKDNGVIYCFDENYVFGRPKGQNKAKLYLLCT